MKVSWFLIKCYLAISISIRLQFLPSKIHEKQILWKIKDRKNTTVINLLDFARKKIWNLKKDKIYFAKSFGILIATFLKISKLSIHYIFLSWLIINYSEKELTSSIALWRWRCKLRALSCCFWACWKISAGKPGRGGRLGRLTGGAAPNIFSKAIRVCSSEEWGSCPNPLFGDWEAVKKNG